MYIQVFYVVDMSKKEKKQTNKFVVVVVFEKISYYPFLTIGIFKIINCF